MPYALADTIRRCARHDFTMEARRVIVVGSSPVALSSSLRGFRGLRTPLLAGAAVGAVIGLGALGGAAHAADKPSAPFTQPAKTEPAVSKQEFMLYARESLSASLES